MSFSESVVTIQRQLTKYLGSEELPKRAMEMVKDVMQADNALLTMVDGKFPKYWVRNAGWVPMSYSLSIVQKAISNEAGYSIGSLAKNPTISQIGGNIQSCVAARVESGDRIIGAFYCDVRAGSKRYTEEDGKLLKNLAECLVIYLEYFELYEKFQTETEEKKDFDDRDLQRMVLGSLIGESPAIQKLKQAIQKTAPLRIPVLISGESGTGKEVVARLLHYSSHRRNKQFVAVNCAAIPNDLLESELFGHERGAFSNAFVKRSGLISTASGGTLLLDEIGDMPLELQAKLLRVLDTKMIRHLGSDVEIGPVDFRLICCSNKDINAMVSARTFREDLFYRIRGRHLHVPSLNNRVEDIPVLASFFARPKKITDEAIELLQSLPWKGNVRELKHFVENLQDVVEGYEISKQAILEELQYEQIGEQEKITASKSMSDIGDFYEIKKLWEKGEISALELENTLKSLYANANQNWNEVGRRLGLNQSTHLKRFRNWITYLKSNRTISLKQ